jgi:hypothetical protein
MVAEIPEPLAPTRELFVASRYVQEAVLTDYVLDVDERPVESARMIVIPVTIDDLEANGLLGVSHSETCWERSVETLRARKDEIEGIAVASDESIEAYILYLNDGEILSLRSHVEDGGVRLKQLLAQLRGRGIGTFRFPKVHPAEIPQTLVETLGFRAAGQHLLFAARARSA